MSFSEILRRRRWHRYERDAARHWETVWEDHWRGKSFSSLLADARASDQFPFLLRHLPESGPVLESGCGHGQWLVALGSDRRSIVGLDRWEAPMHTALRDAPDLRLLRGDVRRLPFRDGRLAAVTSFGVVEHFEEGCGDVLAEMRRVLRRGGVLLISVPYHSLLRRAVEPFRLLREGLRESPGLRRAFGRGPLPPKRFYQFAYTTAEFRRLLAANGFRSGEVLHFDTEFGLVRDFALMRALRRRLPGAFRALHVTLRALSPRITAHMQMHCARIAEFVDRL